MKTEKAVEYLISAIEILKLVKERNLKENEDIDKFLKKVREELGEEPKASPEEKKAWKSVKKAGSSTLPSTSGDDFAKIMEIQKLFGGSGGRSSVTLPMQPSTSGGAGQMLMPGSVTGSIGTGTSIPMDYSLSMKMKMLADEEMRQKAAGAGGHGASIGGGKPIESAKTGSSATGDKVWCTVCEEYHDHTA